MSKFAIDLTNFYDGLRKFRAELPDLHGLHKFIAELLGNEQQRKGVGEKIAGGGNSWLSYDNGYRPSDEEVNAVTMHSLGHDSLDLHYCIQARLDLEKECYDLWRHRSRFNGGQHG